MGGVRRFCGWLIPMARKAYGALRHGCKPTPGACPRRWLCNAPASRVASCLQSAIRIAAAGGIMHTIVSSAKARVRRPRYAPLLIGLGVLLTLTACHRQSEQPSAGSEPPGAPGGPKGASWSGEPLRGDSQVALRAYLTSVEEVKPTKFRVEWNPATVAIDKAAALRSLRAVSHDGTAFTLASDEPAVAKLKPGSIIWIWDIAVRKVDSMEAVGDVTHVHTSAVLLTEAIPNAEIEFETPLKLQNYYPLRTAEPATPQSSARWQRNASGFVLTSLTDLPPEQLPDPDAVSNTDEDNWYDEG